MGNTKFYTFIITFNSGSVEVYEREESLRQAIWRAQTIPGHRLVLKVHEDFHDPQEVGCAPLRLEFLRQKFLAAGIDDNRLELELPLVEYWDTEARRFARRAEVHLFPRVASLHNDGRPFLSMDEISQLEKARQVALLPPCDTESTRKFLERLTSNDWMRIVGHESLDKWVENGARHPRYNRINIEPNNPTTAKSE